MGISQTTALMIKRNKKDIVCGFEGPLKDIGKYTGWIQLHKIGTFHSEVLRTKAVFLSGKNAIAAMENIVKEIKQMEL